MIKLRRFTEFDGPIYHNLANSNPDIAIYVPGLVEATPADTSELVRDFTQVDFVYEFDFIIENQYGIPIGIIDASRSFPYNGLSVSYFIGNGYRRRGYMKDALRAFITYCQKETNYKYLFFDINVKNEPSLKLIESFGGEYIESVNSLYSYSSFYKMRISL